MQSHTRLSRIALSMFIATCSVGWIAPLYLALVSYLQGFEHLLRGTESVNSFPYFHFGSRSLVVSAWWFGLSAVSWASIGVHRLFRGSSARLHAPSP